MLCYGKVKMKLDALIIGAGPAGATTALLLAEAGLSVGIVEKAVFPRRKVCGEFISATNLPLLRKLGIADYYLTHGGPEVRKVGLYASNTVLTSSMPYNQLRDGKWGRALGREHLDVVLLERAHAAGARVWQPAVITDLQQEKGLFSCMINESNQLTEIHSRIVVMANGSWERGPGASSITPHQPSDLLAFKAHFKQCELAEDLMPLLAFPGGYGGLAHSDNQRVTLSCCVRRDILQRIRKENSGLQAGEAVFQYIKTNCQGVRDVFMHAKREGNWLAAGPIRPGIRQCYQNNLFFVGNAAGEAHPVVAEGISIALQSAWLLSQVLIKHYPTQNFDAAGQAYTQLWRKHFASRIYASTVFARLAMMPPFAIQLMLPIFKLFPSLLTFGAKLSGKIQQIVPTDE